MHPHSVVRRVTPRSAFLLGCALGPWLIGGAWQLIDARTQLLERLGRWVDAGRD